MTKFDTNTFVKNVEAAAKNLAETLFKKYTTQAKDDTEQFLQAAKDGIARSALLYQEKKIDKEDLEDLIQGKKDLAEMHALKQAGLASAAIDAFVNGVIQIMIDAAFAAMKI
jgi:hypothetical protein